MEMDVVLMLTLVLWAWGPEPVTTQPTWIRHLWDQITGISDGQTGPNGLLSGYGTEVEDADLLWGIPDTSAAVGHLFRYQIPHNAFTGNVDEFRVHEAGSPDLPPWLYFNTSSQTFLGVASPLDMGATAIEVTTVTKSSNHSVSTHFIIKVQADDPFGNWPGSSVLAREMKYQADGSPVNMEQKQTGSCLLGQNTYRATLILDATMDKLSAKARVKLVYKSAQFLSQQTHSVTVGPKKSDSIARLLDTTTIIAGPGDSKKTSSNSGVELSWVVGCDSFSGARDFAKVLEHNVLVGRFRQEFGYHTIGWLITETLPPESQRILSRQKRQAMVRATLMPTPTLPSSAPTQITDLPTASILETTSLISGLSQTPFPSISQTESVSSFLESSSPSIGDVYTSSVETSDSTQVYTTDFTTSTSSLYTASRSPDITSSESVEGTFVNSSSFPPTASQSIQIIPSTVSTGPFLSVSQTVLPEQSTSVLTESVLSAFPSTQESTISETLLPSVSSEVETTLSGIETTLGGLETPLSHTILQSTEDATVFESLTPSISSTPSSDFASETTSDVVGTISLSPTIFLSTEEPTVIETLLTSDSPSVSSGVLGSISLIPTTSPTSAPEPNVSATTLITEGSEFSSSPTIIPTPVLSASQTTKTLSESVFVSTSILDSTSLVHDSVTSNLFETEFVTSNVFATEMESTSTGTKVLLPSETFSTMSDMVLDSTSLTLLIPSSSTVGLTPSLSLLPSPTSSDVLGTELDTTMSNSVIPTLETSFSSSFPLSIEPTRVSTEATVSAMQTELFTTTQTLDSSSSVSDQTLVIAPSVISTSVTGLGTESVSIDITRSVKGSDSISVPPTLSSTMEGSPSATLVPSTSTLEAITEIPVISVEQTPQLTVSTFETTVLSSDSLLSISSSSSPVSSSPTTSVVNLVSLTPSPGQTLDFIPISHSSGTTEPTLTLSSTRTITAEIPQSPTLTKSQSITMTTSPEPPSSTSIVVLPSSSSEIVTSTSTVILPPPSSTVVSVPGDITSPQPSPTTTSEPPVVSTEFVSTSVPIVSSTVGVISPSASSEIPTTSETPTTTVTTPTVTTTTPVTTSTTTTPNTRPRLIHPIDQINTRLGVYFEYRIPADTFYDPNEGNTRALQLSLLTLNSERLAPDSWVQFDRQRQTIFGFPQVKDLPRTEADKEFVLVAEDTKGLQVQDALKILIDVSSYENLTHQFTVTIDEDYEAFVSQTINMINLISTISTFYGDTSPINMTVTNVSSGSVELHWSNNTLSRVVCENKTIQQLYEQLSGGGKVNPDFRIATFPRYNILDVALRYQGACLPPPVIVTPVPPVEPPILGSTDSSIYYKTIIPAVIIALLLLIGVLICICLQRRKRLAGRLLLDDEKPIFTHDRHPVLLESDLEMRDIGRKSHRPLVLTQDGAYANPTFQVAPQQRRPPARPPPYQVPNDYGPFFDDDFDGASISPPPNYRSDPSGVYGRPPPAYRLPPPYSSRPGSSDA